MKYDINENPEIYDEIAKTVKKQITEHVEKYCYAVFDDPETGISNCCYMFDGIHCVAIDSEYSYMEKGRSICLLFNTLLPMEPVKENADKKLCAYCNRLFIPTSNRQRFCPDCKALAYRESDRKRQQIHRSSENQAA